MTVSDLVDRRFDVVSVALNSKNRLWTFVNFCGCMSDRISTDMWTAKLQRNHSEYVKHQVS